MDARLVATRHPLLPPTLPARLRARYDIERRQRCGNHVVAAPRAAKARTGELWLLVMGRLHDEDRLLNPARLAHTMGELAQTCQRLGITRVITSRPTWTPLAVSAVRVLWTKHVPTVQLSLD